MVKGSNPARHVRRPRGHDRCATLRCLYDFLNDPLGIFKDDPDGFGPSAEPRPVTLASSYLFEALEAIEAAGSSEALYAPAVRAAASRARESGWLLTVQRDAAELRIRYSRNAMLFAAFAAEAYVNEFIGQHFAGKDYDAVERFSTIDKYVLAPRTALGREVLPRDREPVQTLRKLFRHRDVLVHPKPGAGLPDQIRTTGYPRRIAADPVYNPSEAAAMVLAVAEAADIIVREGELGSGFDAHARVVIRGRAALERYASQATDALPPPDAPRHGTPLLTESGKAQASAGLGQP